MKKIAIGLLMAGVLALHAGAAEPEWLTDLTKAQAKAKAENKLVLVEFTGSDWCPPCKALHKTVFSSSEFADYAKKSLVLVEADFPRNKPQSSELKKANQELSKKFEIEGFPTVVVLDAGGKQLSKQVGYDGAEPKAFIAKIEALRNKK